MQIENENTLPPWRIKACSLQSSFEMGNNQHYKKEKSSLLVFRCLTAIQPTFNTCRNRLFLIKVENPEWEEKKKQKQERENDGRRRFGLERTTVTRKPKVLLLPLQKHNCLISIQWQLASKCRNLFLLMNHKGLENF